MSLVVLVMVLVTEEEGRLVEVLEGLLGPAAGADVSLVAGVFLASEAEMLVEVMEGAGRLVAPLVTVMGLVAPWAGGCAMQK